MTSLSTTTNPESFIREKARKLGRLPYAMDPGYVILICPGCGKNVPVRQDELGTVVTHDKNHCRTWRGWCDEQFYVHPSLRGIIYRGRAIGTADFEESSGR